MLHPGAKLLPAPFVHADLSALAGLAAADEQSAASRVEITLGQAQDLGDPKPRPP